MNEGEIRSLGSTKFRSKFLVNRLRASACHGLETENQREGDGVVKNIVVPEQLNGSAAQRDDSD